jgi:hypothetical protein
MGEMSGIIIAIMKKESNLCIFYKERRKDINNKDTNTDRNLVLITVNKVVSYRDFQELRFSYGIDTQDPYFFIEKKLLSEAVIYQRAGY